MIESKGISVSALGLGLACAAMAQNFASVGDTLSAREQILFGLPGAAALSAASLLFSGLAMRYRIFESGTALSRCANAAFLLWFGAELVRTVLDAQSVCRQQFGSNALIGLLPLLVLLSGWMENHAYNYTARILWWLLLAAGAVCVIGLAGQMHWQRLFGPETGSVWQTPLPQLALYPEYFSLAFLCTRGRERSGAFLPFWAFGIQAGYSLALELVLGLGRMRSPDYTGLELLRAWGFGFFSRLDAVLILIWLAIALFRICFLCSCIQLLWRRSVALVPGRAGKEGRA